MTNAELIAKIKAEIERRMKEIKSFRTKPGDEYIYGHLSALKGILSFLDTLEKSEKPMNQEGLEEEIKRAMVKLPFFIRGKDQIAFARHFAQWGAEHLKK